MIFRKYESNKKRSIRNEKKVARKINARLIARSGSGDEKGDLIDSKYLYEDKHTVGEYIRFKKEWFGKIKKEAEQFNREPCFTVSLKNKLYKVKLTTPHEDYIEVKGVTKRIYPKHIKDGLLILKVGNEYWRMKEQ